MKHSPLYLSVLIAAISGCSTSMFYGNKQAPVIQENAFYSSNVEQLGNNYQPPQSSVSNYPPVEQNTVQGMEQVADDRQGINAEIGVNQPSPYAPVESGDDGWAIKPGETVQNGETVVDPNAPLRPTEEGQVSMPSTADNSQATRSQENLRPGTPATQPQTNPSQSVQEVPQENTQQAAPQQPSASANNYIRQASAALGKGDLDGAVSYLEEAQRIDSRNPKISYDIANIRYHQGKFREAEAAAGRSVQIGGDTAIMQKAWSVIANARKSLGDNQGAISAAEKAASYQ